MTDAKLKQLGIWRDGGKSKPNRYWCEITNTNMQFFRADTIKDVLEAIFDEGIKQGAVEGKKQHQKELREFLGIETETHKFG